MLGIKKNSESKGMTYMEVAACLFAIAVIVTPLCVALITATKTRASSETIRQSTFYAESLMADLKFQMTSDINLKIKKEGKTITPGAISSIGDRLDYLSVTTPIAIELDLRDFMDVIGDIDTKYNTTRYAYEIAIWKDNHLDVAPPPPAPGPGSDFSLHMNEDTLKNAVRLYTEPEPTLRFAGYTPADQTVSFTVKNELAQVLKDKAYIDRFIPANIATAATYEIIDTRTITIEKTEHPSGDIYDSTFDSIITPSNLGYLLINDGFTNPDHTRIRKFNGEVVGYNYTITTSSAYAPTTTPPKYGNIVLDLRQVVRDFPTTTELAFKFINETDHLMNIKILRNIKEGTSETYGKIDKQIDLQFSIIGENITPWGKINIERIDDKILQSNYIIAIVVRERDPSMGERGKIIKKMVDVYSYTPPKG